MTPLYKGTGNVTECNNYRGIKLMCHGMKLYERLVEDRLSKVLRVNRSRTEYLPPSSCHDSKCKLGIEQINNVKKVKGKFIPRQYVLGKP